VAARGGAGSSRVAVAMAARLGLDTVLGIKPRVQGLERVPQGGAILAFNHLSPIDPFVVAWLLARGGHADPVVLLRGDLPRIPMVSKLLDAGVLRIDDDASDEDDDDAGSAAFEQAVEQIAAGRPVLVAPERGVSPSLELMPLSNSAARLAAATGAPLVPVGLFGTNRLFDGDRFRVRRGLPVTVVFGHPVIPGGIARAVTKRLHLDMEALYEQALDDYPDREEGTQGAEWWPARRGGSAPTLAAVIDARAAGEPLHTDLGDDDPVGAELWSEETVDDTEDEEQASSDERTRLLRAMSHDELLERYPLSYHRNAAQQGGYLRDLKAVLAFDQPGQPHMHHPVVHLDHHADGQVTVHWDGGRLTLAAVDMAASAVRVVVYGRLAADHEVDGQEVRAGTLTTLLGVPQDRPRPEPEGAWEAVRSMHLRA
jgi:1-acyl-sn-glycerol-3-phosphate acyltransferase